MLDAKRAEILGLEHRCVRSIKAGRAGPCRGLEHCRLDFRPNTRTREIEHAKAPECAACPCQAFRCPWFLDPRSSSKLLLELAGRQTGGGGARCTRREVSGGRHAGTNVRVGCLYDFIDDGAVRMGRAVPVV